MTSKANFEAHHAFCSRDGPGPLAEAAAFSAALARASASETLPLASQLWDILRHLGACQPCLSKLLLGILQFLNGFIR